MSWIQDYVKVGDWFTYQGDEYLCSQVIRDGNACRGEVKDADKGIKNCHGYAYITIGAIAFEDGSAKVILRRNEGETIVQEPVEIIEPEEVVQE